MKKKKVLFVVNVIAIIALAVVAWILPSKIAEKNLDDVFE